MTTYAGEELEVRSTITGFDGEAITPLNIDVVTVSIFNADLVAVVDEETMSYDDNWYFVWNTFGLDPGTYKVRVSALGLSGGKSIEWKRARLSRQPIVT